jgi:hypothetical protein
MGVIWLVEELTAAVSPAVPPNARGTRVLRTAGPGEDADADSQSLAAAAAWVGAPGHSGVVPRQLPHALAGFVGREAEMTTLTGLLDRSGGSPGTVVISAIGGTAGVGVHP